jgi:hypothetical protein
MTIQLELKDTQTLEKEILDTKNTLLTDRMIMSFGEVMSMYERAELIINSEYLKLFRWNDYQKTRLEKTLFQLPRMILMI